MPPKKIKVGEVYDYTHVDSVYAPLMRGSFVVVEPGLGSNAWRVRRLDGEKFTGFIECIPNTDSKVAAFSSFSERFTLNKLLTAALKIKESNDLQKS